MSSNQKTYTEFVRNIYAGGKTDDISRIVAFRLVEHQKGIYPPTIDGLVGWVKNLRGSFSNFKVEVSELAEHDDRIWARLIMEGTHIKEFMGIEPSGKHIVVDFMEECRFHDSQIVEHWGVFDRFALIQQISTGKLSIPHEGGSQDVSPLE